MKLKVYFLAAAAAWAASSILVDGVVQAATKPTQMLEFTASTATQSVTVRPDSFYNLTMGYKGWTHHSAWGYAKFIKGKPVSITATAASTDEGKKAAFHPGIAVWSTPQKKGKYVDISYNPDHFYQQWTSVLEKNPKDDDDKEVKGLLKWDFITNGFDRDGMSDTLPVDYDQSFVHRILDGTPGTVQVTFTPPATGIYKFAIGGINPGTDLLDAEGKPLTEVQAVSVTVGFPQ